MLKKMIRARQRAQRRASEEEASAAAAPRWRCPKCDAIQTARFRCEGCGHTLRIFSLAALANQGAGETLSAAAIAAAGPPERPDVPIVASVGADSVELRWTAPWPDGGSPVNLFSVEVKCLSSPSSSPSAAQRRTLEVGLHTQHTIDELVPNAVYSFKVLARNAAGFTSPASPSVATRTLRPPPSAPPRSVLRQIGAFSEVWDESAERVYYYDATSGRATWDAPIAFDPANTAFAKKRFRLMKEIRKPRAGGVVVAPAVQLSVRRSDVLDDSMAWWRTDAASSDNDHARLRIEFLGEPAIDSGGVANEWFDILSSEIFHESALFDPCPAENVRAVMPRAGATDEVALERLRFGGWMLAKALVRGRLVRAPLAEPIFRLICCCAEDPAAHITMDDLRIIDPALAQSWEWLLRNDLEPLASAGLLPSLTVVRSTPSCSGAAAVMEEGAVVEVEIEISEANKEALVAEALVSLLYTSRRCQIDALRSGFASLRPALPPLLEAHGFSGAQLSLLLNGRAAEEVGIETIRNSVVFAGGYTEDSPAVRFFFRALDRFSTEQLRMLLSFCTGSSHVPLDGWQPALTVVREEIVVGREPLPRAHTCFNRLVLPNYSSFSVLLKKLLFAIESCQGFQLT